MSNIHEMLKLGKGTFQGAEQFALDLIAKGHSNVWLDLGLLFHAQGNLEGCRQAQSEYAKVRPDCERLAFARTWLALHDGDLERGLLHIEAGRACGTLGEVNFSHLHKTKYAGQDLRNKTVLLYGEGGQGDQMMGLRSAQWLKSKGARIVIVACSKSVFSLFQRAPGVDVVTLCEAAGVVSYDYWVPMMSSFRLCNVTWETMWPGQFLFSQDPQNLWSKIIPKQGNKLNIGIRWCGNPEFEHEQLRWFPPEYLFHAIENLPANFYSLQKDCPSVELPSFVTDLQGLLGTWEETAAAIDRLDLVITSCTAIAHLAAAMGKPTWVIIPAMPYYPWARPSIKSDWYPSVTLFRQKCYGDWLPPFMRLKDVLRYEVEKRIGLPQGPVAKISLDDFYLAHVKPTPCDNLKWMEGDEITVLEGLIRKNGIRTILDIGINKGETARRILDICPQIMKYDGIEITEEGEQGLQESQKGERAYAGKDVGIACKGDPRVTLHITPQGSGDFSRTGNYEMVLIDGSHEEKWVRHDIQLARDLKARVIVLHDYGTEHGVVSVVNAETGFTHVLGTRMVYSEIKP